MQPRLPLPICSPHVVLAASGLGSPCRPRPAICHLQRRVLASRTHLCSSSPPTPPPLLSPPSPPRWYCTVSELNTESKRVGAFPRRPRLVGGTGRASHYVGRGRLQGWRKFFFYIFLFLEEEEDVRSRKGAALLLAASPGIFFGRLLFVLFFFPGACFSLLSPSFALFHHNE